ncbi:Rpn family recombination-promoting nuclease/putative transposase [Dolichospermum sp. ST_con]|nr:Rpn family recombination-promoting nuclease/putative transposase [Dolichospermum sp. ST_con]MDD1419855.1 Rpn family recombination-promoting nuclease/putative transposase [Dolichospermum sp. ST_sed1]MDD1426377.1 Rpn family recombination-promoting nuclease/putative transposase [Dolichospermum sp. ST_sed9]MDD1429955.1 Rpn family recombination-promoting nuclease/putative transposase [Dolichospermum sp. ST_sed6]MDD1435934.1 Rpn family recombination-promoting nuclease/putative transposase [Dolicho
MRRDSIFYYLFQKYPTILFELLENPPANAVNYRFDSVAVKEPKFEIDGVFLPPETELPGVVYFCEVQFQKDERLYERLFGELFLYFYRNRERFQDWQAVVIYPTRSTEQREIQPYRSLLNSEQVHRVYLDELGEIEELPLDVSLLVLTTLKQNKAPTAARYLINRCQQELAEPAASRAIMEIITTIISYRFTRLTRVEIEAMLGITFEQTRLYQELNEEATEKGMQRGEANLILRLLSKRFGEVPSQLKSQIEGLSLPQLEALTEMLLDFVSLDDLVVWLQNL